MSYTPKDEANGLAALDSAGHLLASELPLTTKGDLLVSTGAANVALPVGTNGQVLTADSAQADGVKWATPTDTGITELTGDVTAGPGSGSQAATVASVGGSSAANVNTATVAANAATSANTPSTIVKRDGSGNFVAGTITASLTGNATNITASSNATLTTLSSLSLPGAQVTGNISGNAANVTGTVAIANGGTGQTTAPNAFNALSPMTTAGDLIRGGTAGAGTRLGIGSTGQVLTVVAGLPAWASTTGGLTIQTVSTTTASSSGVTYLCDTSGAAFTLTLPAPALNASVTVKDSTGSFFTNNLTVAPNGAEKIDGVAASLTLDANWESFQFISNGTDWFII